MNSVVSIEHYTYMRLYSISKTWREDADYVQFSIFRLIAFGKLKAEVLKQLPPAVGLKNVNQLQRAELHFGPFAKCSQ